MSIKVKIQNEAAPHKNAKNRLHGLEPAEVSLVTSPANKKRFAIVMGDDAPDGAEDILNTDDKVQPGVKDTAITRFQDIHARASNILERIGSLEVAEEDEWGGWELPDDITADMVAMFSLMKALLERVGSWAVLMEEQPKEDVPEANGDIFNVEEVLNASMTPEELLDAARLRSEKYGIEMRVDSWSVDGAEVEIKMGDFADPVNMTYPIGTPEMLSASMNQFKSGHDYSEKESDLVYTRMLSAEIQYGLTNERALQIFEEAKADLMKPDDMAHLKGIVDAITMSSIAELEEFMEDDHNAEKIDMLGDDLQQVKAQLPKIFNMFAEMQAEMKSGFESIKRKTVRNTNARVPSPNSSSSNVVEDSPDEAWDSDMSKPWTGNYKDSVNRGR